MPIVSRSAMVTRSECTRLRVLEYHWCGRGLRRKARALPLIDGVYMHKALEALLLSGRAHDHAHNQAMCDTIMAEIRPAYADEARAAGIANDDGDLELLIAEQLCLLEGALRTWAYQRLPALLEEYEPIAVEQEFSWQLSEARDIVQPLRMDCLMERRDDRLLHILDFKTASYPGMTWARKFEHDEQTLSYTLAAQETFHRPIGGLIYEGLVVGQRKRDTAKSSPFYGLRVQNSPYCYGYKFDGPIPVYQTEYTAKKGWRKVRAWEEMTPKEWFETVLLPEHRLTGSFQTLFVVNPPLLPTPREQEEWREETLRQEVRLFRNLDELASAQVADLRHGTTHEQERVLREHFPKNRARCFKFGEDHVCGMYDMCWNETVAEDPLGSGLYEWREDHHAIKEDL